MPLDHLAFGVKLQEFVGHVLHGLLHARLGLGPRCRPQVAQSRTHAFGRAIFLNQVQPREGHVEPRSVGEFQEHELRRTVALVDFLQPLVLADAMLHVNHIIANLQIAEIGNKCRNFRPQPLRPSHHSFRLVEQVARSENCQAGVGKQNSVGHVGLYQRSRKHVAGKIGSLVGIALAASRPTA